jgi:hypothetical protein
VFVATQFAILVPDIPGERGLVGRNDPLSEAKQTLVRQEWLG